MTRAAHRGADTEEGRGMKGYAHPETRGAVTTAPAAPGAAGGAEELRSREEVVGGWRLRLTSYRFGGEFVCVAANVDPGANIARARGTSREEAEERALVQAERRLTRTSHETRER
jgi:hypothetical protein